VGIALALLGTFFLAYASVQAGLESTLALKMFLKNASQLSKPWLHAAFILLLVGYGTKMGLAPDAHLEAGSLRRSAGRGRGDLCRRGDQLCVFGGPAYLSDLSGRGRTGLYFTDAAVHWTVFDDRRRLVHGQPAGLQRMLAYSSVEHMGILVLGLGIGGPALFGTLLHILTNGLTKGVLFLSSGNIHRAYDSKSTDVVRGAMRRLPLSGTLFLAGFLAITGSPPFGPFVSEFSILNGAFDAGRFWTAGLFLFLLLVIFIGMGKTVLQVVQGSAPAQACQTPYRDGLLTAAPVVILMGLVLLLGLLFLPH
jgi:hydrogenase-4 component F